MRAAAVCSAALGGAVGEDVEVLRGCSGERIEPMGRRWSTLGGDRKAQAMPAGPPVWSGAIRMSSSTQSVRTVTTIAASIGIATKRPRKPKT